MGRLCVIFLKVQQAKTSIFRQWLTWHISGICPWHSLSHQQKHLTLCNIYLNLVINTDQHYTVTTHANCVSMHFRQETIIRSYTLICTIYFKMHGSEHELKTSQNMNWKAIHTYSQKKYSPLNSWQKSASTWRLYCWKNILKSCALKWFVTDQKYICSGYNSAKHLHL